MQIGIHTFVWNDGQTTRDLEIAMEKSREAGFDLIEFPGFDRKAVNIAALVKRAEALGLTIAASAGLPPEHDLTSDDPDVIKSGETFLTEAVSVAIDLGSTQMSGPIFSAHQKFTRLPTAEGWKRSAEVLARTAELAKSGGVALSLELVNRYETNLINTVRQGLAYIEETGSDNIFLHLDTYHMNIEEADPAQAIRLAGDKIGYFHVGENHRGYLGAGTIDFTRSFDALVDIGYDGNISVEAFNDNGLGDHMKAVCAIWRETWTDGMDFARHSKTFIEDRLDEARRRAAVYTAS